MPQNEEVNNKYILYHKIGECTGIYVAYRLFVCLSVDLF